MTELDDLTGIPRYLQIATILEAEIHAGTWAPLNPVPSRASLVGRFGVANTTVARSHAYLARRGYLVPVRGVGMVVTPAERWPAAR
jgi:DNA-binding GntR family transcriptional regulator